MLWAVQQLGHTPGLLWVSMVATQASGHVDSLAADSPALLATLAAGLHTALCDERRATFALSTSQQVQLEGSGVAVSQPAAKQGGKVRKVVKGTAPRTNTATPYATAAVPGSAYADDHLSYLDPYGRQAAQLVLVAAAAWLKAASDRSELVKTTDPRVLLTITSALACMQLRHDDSLYPLLQQRLPVAPAFAAHTQKELQAEVVATHASQAGPAPKQLLTANRLAPDAVWLVRACGVLHADALKRSPDTAEWHCSVLVALLALQRATGGEASPVVRKAIQARLAALMPAVQQLSDSTHTLLTPDQMHGIMLALKASALAIPPPLAVCYYNIRVQGGLLAATAALDQLQALGFTLQLWHVQTAVQALGNAQSAAGSADQQLLALSEMLRRLLRFMTSRDRLGEAASGKQDESGQLAAVREYLSNRLQLQDIVASPLTAQAYLSSCVTALQLQAVYSGGSAEEIRDSVALGCLSDFNQWLPVERLQAAVRGAGASDSAGRISPGDAAVLHLHTALVSTALASQQRESAGTVKVSWQAMQPSMLTQAYDASGGFWTTVLLRQLVRVRIWMRIINS
jgi:hypothetical protein